MVLTSCPTICCFCDPGNYQSLLSWSFLICKMLTILAPTFLLGLSNDLSKVAPSKHLALLLDRRSVQFPRFHDCQATSKWSQQHCDRSSTGFGSPSSVLRTYWIDQEDQDSFAFAKELKIYFGRETHAFNHIMTYRLHSGKWYCAREKPYGGWL